MSTQQAPYTAKRRAVTPFEVSDDLLEHADIVWMCIPTKDGPIQHKTWKRGEAGDWQPLVKGLQP